MNSAQTTNRASGSAPEPEYRQRLQQVQARMAERDLAALVVTDPANLFYLTGYDAWSFYMPQCLIVPVAGQPEFFARQMDAADALFGSDLGTEDGRDRVHGYPEDLVDRADTHPFGWIARRGLDTGVLPAQGRIGIEGEAHFFSVRGYLALADAVGAVRLTDSGQLVNWVRLVKSEFEQRQLRRAGQITEQVMAAALDAVRPGVRQCDAAAEILAAQAHGTQELGGDYAAIVPMMPTGRSAGVPHLTWTDRPFVRGEATTVELSGVYQRYHAPLARTVMLGDPAPQLTHVADVVGDGVAAALDAIKPGATAADVHAVFNAFLTQHDLRKDSRVGYSIGIGYPPDWGERTVSLRPGDATELKPGMAFHLMAGMWMGGWGYEMSESLLVADTGAQQLTRVDPGLTIKKN
jgi:ectoine hydrolase